MVKSLKRIKTDIPNKGYNKTAANQREGNHTTIEIIFVSQKFVIY